jgi:hypothetical protein
MAKKLQVSGNFTEGYHLLAIVSNLPDYRLSYFINDYWNIGLKKYTDFDPDFSGSGFSWYYCLDDDREISYYLFANKSQGMLLKKELKQFDYLLLMKGNFANHFYDEKTVQLRKVPQIIGVFPQDLQKLKNMDEFLEALEMHELKEVIIPSKPKKYPFKS